MSTNAINEAIESLSSSTDLLELLRSSARLAQLVDARPDDSTLFPLVQQLIELDGMATLAGIEALGAMHDPRADQQLIELLSHPDQLIARHASWRITSATAAPRALLHLSHRVTLGGIDTLHAHVTLRRLASGEPRPVIAALGQMLPSVEPAEQRARLVDVLGVIDHPAADAALSLIASDPSEAIDARLAAIAALGHRGGMGSRRLLDDLARGGDEVAMRAALAVDDLLATSPVATEADRNGLRVAQLTLAGHLDPSLQNGGRGDTGGVASLLVSLGQTLARRPEVAKVLTIGRGNWDDVIAGQPDDDDDHHQYAALPIGDEARPWTTSSAAWEHLPAIERGLTSVLSATPVDLIHLRMADVGTLAAANVAGRLGIPVCFSLAPDPHGVIRSRQLKGELDRASFVRRDAEEHLWFRARLVERMAREASQLALFPRRDHADLVRDLAVEPTARSLVVPEGVDIAELRRAETDLARCVATPTSHDGDVLDDVADRIPPERRDLPLLVSVGRLQPVKGMDRVVKAWADDPDRWSSSNLVIVGGELDNPSEPERAILDAIDRTVGPDHPARPGLILCGGRPRADVARLLVATVAGRAGSWAPGGVYVNGAYKEEFGLALLEALAIGLPVVAPSTGGPPTYVDDDETGILVDPHGDLGAAIDRAFELVDRPGRVARARSLVEDRYSIGHMADRLIELYRPPVPALARS